MPEDEFKDYKYKMGHNPQAQDLPRSKHILAEGKTPEGVTILSTDDLIGVTQNLRDCEGTIDICLACRTNGFI